MSEQQTHLAAIIHRDMVAINTRMLSCAQALYRASPAEAMIRTGMSKEQLEGLSMMTTDDIDEISRDGRIKFNIDHSMLSLGQQSTARS